MSKSTQKKAASNPIENPSRRGFLVNSMNYGILATAALSTGYGIAEARQTPQVKEVPVLIPNLPAQFEGFRIVQITDVHISPTFRRSFVEEIVAVVNTLNADIVALTGDLVDGTVEQLADDAAPLGKIKSALGNYFVTGNHEYYSGAIEWIEEVRRLGFSVLLNEHHLITSGKHKMLLAGVTDYRAGRLLPQMSRSYWPTSPKIFSTRPGPDTICRFPATPTAVNFFPGIYWWVFPSRMYPACTNTPTPRSMSAAAPGTGARRCVWVLPPKSP
jgi:hypothetical protein